MKTGQRILITVAAIMVFSLGYMADALAECRWDGTAPYCAGECSPGETEEARADSAAQAAGLPSVNAFGNGCVFGTKAYCCKTPGITCRWDGTAPFCEGSCKADEKAVQFCDNCSGKSCWTGVKVKCCKSHPGSSGQPLQTGVKDARYAAIWEKASGPAWVARHGMTAAKYQQEFDKFVGEGYRLVHISGYGIGAKSYFAAIWQKVSGPAWVARHDMTAAQYQQEFDKFANEGYRLIDISGYAVGGTPYFAAIWERKTRNAAPWVARHNMTAAQYQQEFDKFAKDGYRLVDVSGYGVSDKPYFAAIWEKASGPAWVARHNMTSAQYQQEFNKFVEDGYRLVHISGYSVAGKPLYAAIWEKAYGPAWAARHGMTSDGYQEEFNYLAKEGYRLSTVSGFHAY